MNFLNFAALNFGDKELMYKEYKQLNLSNTGKEILDYWKRNNIFDKSISNRQSSKPYTFYEGPPSANGMPGIHHVMARGIKDIFCRYKTLKGFQVKRKGGWDTHGLPIELAVEKTLGITKDDIGKKISVQDYNDACRKEVMRYTNVWNDLTEKMGYWVDLNDPYITYENRYIETLWWILKEFYKKGLLYKGYTIQPFSPAAGTGLSSHELNQPGTYRDIKDTSIVAQFQIKTDQVHPLTSVLFQNEAENTNFIAWTTTPWTLPSNSALAVGNNISYVKIRTFNQYTFAPTSVILAKDLVSKHFKTDAQNASFQDYKGGDKLIPWEVAAEFKGADLVGLRYYQLLPYVSNEELEEKGFRVIAGDFVTTEDGTGIVHIAPTFGADDFRVAKTSGIPAVLVTDADGKQQPLVTRQGKFVDEITDFAGQYVKEEYYSDEVRKDPNFRATDVLIAIKLKEENKAFDVKKYEHSYPHCWRTDKPLLYYPLDSWFIKTTAVKDRLVELNKSINWKPESTGTGRFGNWLENLVDWNLSRSRYWGTPLPIWRTEDELEELCIGSIDELNSEIQKSVKAGYMEASFEINDMHRPFVDDVILVSPTGKKMIRETDL
ncbi:MAG: Isoleucyl-tRNA synthetase, partial [Daejeonella sp.]|nr:Isoleucyl-tRNA synthetase [Daejeonella sp.]